MNPDMALARLARAVPEFTDQVRPICLARPGGEERPTCPDSSVDRKIRVRTYGDASVATGEDRTVLGGCSTDHSDISLEKSSRCLDHWRVRGRTVDSCTKL